MTAPIQFAPSRVEGLPAVTRVVVHPDRLEIESEGTWRTSPFARMGRPRTVVGKLFRLVGIRVGPYLIGARDWFHAPRDRFLRFDASPPLTVFLPDTPDEESRALYIQIRDCIHSSGRYATDDLG